MRALALLSLATLSACASSGPAGTPAVKPASQTINGSGAGVGALTINTQTNTDIVKMPYAAENVFRILPSVYDSLGIPVTLLTPATKTIGNPSFKTRQRLGKLPMSRFLDCGSSTQIGPNADSYDIVINVSTNVAADGPNGSTITTVFEAQARPATFNQGYNRCSSKGALETRLTEIIKARLSQP